MLIIAMSSMLTGCLHPHPEAEISPGVALNLQLSKAYFKRGQVTEAKRKLLVARRLAPENARVFAAWAQYYSETGRAHDATQYFQLAIKRAPHQAWLMDQYGMFLCENAPLSQAMAAYKAAYTNPNVENAALPALHAVECLIQHSDVGRAKKLFIFASKIDSKLARKDHSLYDRLHKAHVPRK